MNRFAALAISASLSLGAGLPMHAPAYGADFAEGYYLETSICNEEWVLRRIADNFAYQVKHVPNLPNVAIVDFDGIHQRRALPETEVWPVARVYCGATVLLSDGMTRPVWYFIEEGMGFAGIGANVEACVAGFDRWNVYDGRCRVAR